MAYKQKGWSAFTKKDDDKKKIKSTISNQEAKDINIENISAVQNKGGKIFVVEVDKNEYYDPNVKDNIGGKDDKWDSNYNDTNNKRDTVVVNKSYNVGDLVDETDWETGNATKKKKAKSPMKKTIDPPRKATIKVKKLAGGGPKRIQKEYVLPNITKVTATKKKNKK